MSGYQTRYAKVIKITQGFYLIGLGVGSGAHRGEPLSPILGFGVNSFLSRSINGTPPSVRRANQNRAMTIIVLPTCTQSGWGQRGEIR